MSPLIEALSIINSFISGLSYNCSQQTSKSSYEGCSCYSFSLMSYDLSVFDVFCVFVILYRETYRFITAWMYWPRLHCRMEMRRVPSWYYFGQTKIIEIIPYFIFHLMILLCFSSQTVKCSFNLMQVHKLDRESSGLLLMGRSKESFSRLSWLFSNIGFAKSSSQV